ncbi:MAG: phosphatase PAP2 family protein [Actinomyces sp.]|nr:phosphatase PAP2 family protein [Actinomyces sp.]
MTSDLHVRSQRPPALREIIALSLACLAYSVLSFLAKAPESVAVAHAHEVATFESRIGIFIEGSVNTWLTAHPLLASLASAQYAVSFLAMTGFALVTLWRKAPTHYRRARWTLVIMTIGALITYWTYPLAPPRLVPDLGFVDAVAAHTSAYSHLFGTLANPYGAMPSMHTGWSVWVAVMLGTYVWRSWWARLILALHPAITIVTIVATANHYVVDAIGGCVYFLLAWLFVTILNRALLRNVRTTGETS